MTGMPDVFLESCDPLVPTNAVAALLLLGDGRYIMQLRDSKPQIFYPGHWGLFGGALDYGESETEALLRELREELGFSPRTLTRFVRLDFDLTAIGAGKLYRAVYEVPVSEAELAAFQLGEGLACRALTPRAILTELKVTPYDSFAVWLHFSKERLAPSARTAFKGRPPLHGVSM